MTKSEVTSSIGYLIGDIQDLITEPEIINSGEVDNLKAAMKVLQAAKFKCEQNGI